MKIIRLIVLLVFLSNFFQITPLANKNKGNASHQEKQPVKKTQGNSASNPYGNRPSTGGNSSKNQIADKKDEKKVSDVIKPPIIDTPTKPKDKPVYVFSHEKKLQDAVQLKDIIKQDKQLLKDIDTLINANKDIGNVAASTNAKNNLPVGDGDKKAYEKKQLMVKIFVVVGSVVVFSLIYGLINYINYRKNKNQNQQKLYKDIEDSKVDLIDLDEEKELFSIIKNEFEKQVKNGKYNEADWVKQNTSDKISTFMNDFQYDPLVKKINAKFNNSNLTKDQIQKVFQDSNKVTEYIYTLINEYCRNKVDLYIKNIEYVKDKLQKEVDQMVGGQEDYKKVIKELQQGLDEVRASYSLNDFISSYADLHTFINSDNIKPYAGKKYLNQDDNQVNNKDMRDSLYRIRTKVKKWAESTKDIFKKKNYRYNTVKGYLTHVENIHNNKGENNNKTQVEKINSTEVNPAVKRYINKKLGEAVQKESNDQDNYTNFWEEDSRINKNSKKGTGKKELYSGNHDIYTLLMPNKKFLGGKEEKQSIYDIKPMVKFMQDKNSSGLKEESE